MSVCTVAVLPRGLFSLCVLSSSKALCPHSSSLSTLAASSTSSLLSSPSQDTLWAGLCSERRGDAEGRLGATLHTAMPLLLATPRTLDISVRKLLNCKSREIYKNLYLINCLHECTDKSKKFQANTDCSIKLLHVATPFEMNVCQNNS